MLPSHGRGPGFDSQWLHIILVFLRIFLLHLITYFFSVPYIKEALADLLCCLVLL
ncbi:hypothetical protein BJX65DRAFT_268794 [Aspergillus insuetus]